MGSVVRRSSWQSLAIFSPALTAKGAVRRPELGWLLDCPTLRDFTTKQITPKCATSATGQWLILRFNVSPLRRQTDRNSECSTTQQKSPPELRGCRLFPGVRRADPERYQGRRSRLRLGQGDFHRHSQDAKIPG